MALPTISNFAQMQQYLATWQQQIKQTLKKVTVPTIPWNFTVTTKQGGNLMNWAQVAGADGYEILISADGTFTDTTVVRLSNSIQTSYFDAVPVASGATPPKRYYKMHATAGTMAAPQSVVGKDTQPISATAIAPNNTATASTSTTDSSTDDSDQRCTKLGTWLEAMGGELRVTLSPWSDWVEIVLADGTRLEGVPEHPVYTDRGKVGLVALHLGEKVITKRGMVAVTKQRRYYEPGFKLNATVPGGAMYWAAAPAQGWWSLLRQRLGLSNAILSHNNKFSG